jgi:hypothetical protein
VVHVQITTKDTPKYALKGWQPRAIDHTSDEPEVRIRDEATRGRGSALLEVELDVRRRRILVFAILVLEQRGRTIIK